MELKNLEVLLLHQHPDYLNECCNLINDEWPRSETARMNSLLASCDILPTSLILINDKKHVIGHCKLTLIPSIPESCFLETVVISKALRGKKLGTFLMKKAEEYCKEVLQLKMLHLSTKGQENFYAKLGYEICAPVSIYGTRIMYDSTPSPKSHNDKSPVPIKRNTPSSGVPPPPPPPMPINENVINNNVVKTTKTFMFKYL